MIFDRTGATVQLSQAMVTIQEGDSGTNTTAPLCLTLTDAMGGLRRDVVVNLSTQDRIASKYLDDIIYIVFTIICDCLPQWHQIMITIQSKINN